MRKLPGGWRGIHRRNWATRWAPDVDIVPSAWDKMLRELQLTDAQALELLADRRHKAADHDVCAAEQGETIRARVRVEQAGGGDMVKQGCCGGGVNSTAMFLGMYEREECCDVVLFADPGGENPATYRHVDALSEWLVDHGFPPIITVREERWTLEQDCLNHHTLPSIVTGIRSCSDKSKVRPQDRYMAAWQPAIDAWKRGEQVTKLVGFDAGEPWRVNDFISKRYVNRYPLIEWGWEREQCVAAIERHGLKVPPKSSCFFCPEMQEWEIVELAQKHPELAARAIAMEHNNTTLHSVKGLKRTTSFEAIIDYYNRQGELPILNMPSRIPCMCFDGE